MTISDLFLPILNNLGEAKVSDLDAPLAGDEKILCHSANVKEKRERRNTRASLDDECNQALIV